MIRFVGDDKTKFYKTVRKSSFSWGLDIFKYF